MALNRGSAKDTPIDLTSDSPPSSRNDDPWIVPDQPTRRGLNLPDHPFRSPGKKPMGMGTGLGTGTSTGLARPSKGGIHAFAFKSPDKKGMAPRNGMGPVQALPRATPTSASASPVLPSFPKQTPIPLPNNGGHRQGSNSSTAGADQSRNAHMLKAPSKALKRPVVAGRQYSLGSNGSSNGSAPTQSQSHGTSTGNAPQTARSNHAYGPQQNGAATKSYVSGYGSAQGEGEGASAKRRRIDGGNTAPLNPTALAHSNLNTQAPANGNGIRPSGPHGKHNQYDGAAQYAALGSAYTSSNYTSRREETENQHRGAQPHPIPLPTKQPPKSKRNRKYNIADEPSVKTLNEELQSKSGPTIWDDLEEEGRPVYIPRGSQGEADRPSQSVEEPAPVPRQRTVAPQRIVAPQPDATVPSDTVSPILDDGGLLSSTLDEDSPQTTDTDSILALFNPRKAPLEKHKSQTPLEKHKSQTPVQKSKSQTPVQRPKSQTPIQKNPTPAPPTPTQRWVDEIAQINQEPAFDEESVQEEMALQTDTGLILQTFLASKTPIEKTKSMSKSHTPIEATRNSQTPVEKSTTPEVSGQTRKWISGGSGGGGRWVDQTGQTVSPPAHRRKSHKRAESNKAPASVSQTRTYISGYYGSGGEWVDQGAVPSVENTLQRPQPQPQPVPHSHYNSGGLLGSERLPTRADEMIQERQQDATPSSDDDSIIHLSSPPDHLSSPPVQRNPFSPVHPQPQATPQAFTSLSRPAPGSTDSQRSRRAFTDREAHLLIYLKEHKGLPWSKIDNYFPDRTVGTLQTKYCTTINKRKRANDPTVAELEAKFGSLRPTPKSVGTGFASGPVSSPLAPSGAPRGRGRPSLNESNNIRPLDLPSRSLPFDEEPVRRGPGRPRREDTAAFSEIALGRSRRNVRSVNYDIRPHRGERKVTPQASETESLDSIIDLASNEDERTISGVTIPRPPPMDMDHTSEDALLVTSEDSYPPYLSVEQRAIPHNGAGEAEWDEYSRREWQGSVIHVDFSEEEMDQVERAIVKLFGDMVQANSRERELQIALRHLPEPKLLQLAHEIRKHIRRDQQSVEAFLQDARNGRLSTTPSIERIATARLKRDFSSSTAKDSTVGMIYQRELGLQSQRGWKTSTAGVSYQTRNKLYDTLGPKSYWTGASKDITTIAWSPDGQFFAAGAINETDRHSMQYNRKNNLLYGDVYNNSIQELAAHRKPREKTESGPNSTHEMHASQDPYLYYTVSQVAFSPDGQYMFSGGFDNQVKIWDTKRDGQRLSKPILLKALGLRSEVRLLDVSCKGLLAVAETRNERAIKVVSVSKSNEDPLNPHDVYVNHRGFSSRKARDSPHLKVLPMALRFEPTQGRHLLAGFGATRVDEMREQGLETSEKDTSGDLCVYDVETQTELIVYGGSKKVFDVDWSRQHNGNIFAVGCVASGGNVNKGTRSAVRVYETNNGKFSNVLEAECPALDMNDVVFCPYDGNIVAAGCTSGSTYVWDLRKPNDWLYKLSHGKSLQPQDLQRDIEETDVGVRFLSWGTNATRLYTGSSDGKIKIWDLTRSASDVFVKDLVDTESEIMCGAFTQDFSKLVVGCADTSVTVLEVGNDDLKLKGKNLADDEKAATLVWREDNEFYDDELPKTSSDALSSFQTPAFNLDPDSGRAAAASLLANGNMQIIPSGGFPIRQAVQGPNYQGPWDGSSVDAPFLREQALQFQYSLAQQAKNDKKCTLPACKDVESFLTDDILDSGRSKDRIPDQLRVDWKAINKPIPMGKTKCTNCGRPARPVEDTSGTGQLCERCQFTCFRCGGECIVRSHNGRVECRVCCREWVAGALGYECVQETGLGVSSGSVPPLREFDAEKDATCGDDMNALTDWYLGTGVCE